MSLQGALIRPHRTVGTECTLHVQYTLEPELEKKNMFTFTKIKIYEKTSRNLLITSQKKEGNTLTSSSNTS